MRTQNAPRIINAAKRLLFLALIAAVAAGCGVKAKDNAPAEKKVAEQPGIPVDASVVLPTDLAEELEVTGTLAANQQVDIISELFRKVVRVNVKDGAFVRKGALLFQLDDQDLQAQLDKLRQQEKLAMLNEQRLGDLVKNQAVVQEDYDQAYTNLKVIQAQIAELQVTIGKTRITAPFDGQVGMVHVHTGAVVSPTMILTNIQDYSNVKVEFSVPEKYTNVIAIGSAQQFTVASDTVVHHASVVAKEARLDQDTRSLLISAVSTNSGRRLLPGQSARIKIPVHASGGALMAATQALIPSSQGYSVFISRNGAAQLVPIQIGQRSPYAVEVLHGLTSGDTIITSNLLRLQPGTPLRFVTVK